MVILKKLKKEAGVVPFNVGQERTIPEKLSGATISKHKVGKCLPQST
jgi:hypothetical protein